MISSNILNLCQHRTWHTLFFVYQTDMIYGSELSKKETIVMYLMMIIIRVIWFVEKYLRPGSQLTHILRTAQPRRWAFTLQYFLRRKRNKADWLQMISNDYRQLWERLEPCFNGLDDRHWQLEPSNHEFRQTIRCVNFRASFVHTVGIPYRVVAQGNPHGMKPFICRASCPGAGGIRTSELKLDI